MMFGIEVHQTRESYFSKSEGPLSAFFLQIPSVFSCVLSEERIEDVCPPVDFSYLIYGHGAQL